MVTNNFIYVCDSTPRRIFLGVLYGYKMALQIAALVLAFSIRKVKIKGLDDAKYIGTAIYVTSIVLAVVIVATYSLTDFINGFAALFSTGFIVGTTVILLLVFVPLVSHMILIMTHLLLLPCCSLQMVGLYKDPKGENIFKNTSMDTSTFGTAVSKPGSDEVMLGMQRRIKELEDEMKKKDVC